MILVVAMSGCSVFKNNDELYKILDQADSAYKQGEWAEAENLYKIIEKRSPQDTHSVFRLGNAYTNQGRYTEAILEYRKVLVRDPNSAKAYNNMAIAHMKEAERAFGSAVVNLSPNDNFGGRACEMLGEVRGLIRGVLQTNVEPMVAEWCRTNKVTSARELRAEDWVKKHGPPMTVLQVNASPQGACAPATGGVVP